MQSRSSSRNVLLAACGLILAVLSAAQALRGTDARALRRASSTDVVRVSTAANLLTVAKVTAVTCQGAEVGTGFVSRSGLVVTAAHVVDGARRAVVQVDGREPVEATVLGVDRSGRDVAVLAVPEWRTIVGAQVETRTLQRGADVAAAGYPLGGVRQTIAGQVLGYVDSGPLAADGARVLTVSIAFEPGMSGGPVVDTEGHVVGIVIGVERTTGTGIAVPVNTVAATMRGEDLAAPRSCGAGG